MRNDDTSETPVQSKLRDVKTRNTETSIYISIAIRTLSLTKNRLFKDIHKYTTMHQFDSYIDVYLYMC